MSHTGDMTNPNPTGLVFLQIVSAGKPSRGKVRARDVVRMLRKISTVPTDR